MKIKNKKLWIGIGVLILLLIMMNPATDEKKEGLFSNVFIGTGLAIVGAVLIAIPEPTTTMGGIAMVGIGIAMVGGGTGGFLEDLIFPKATIPGWVWVGAFLILLFVILKKK